MDVDEKDQIMMTNVWLNLVRRIFDIIWDQFSACWINIAKHHKYPTFGASHFKMNFLVESFCNLWKLQQKGSLCSLSLDVLEIIVCLYSNLHQFNFIFPEQTKFLQAWWSNEKIFWIFLVFVGVDKWWQYKKQKQRAPEKIPEEAN